MYKFFMSLKQPDGSFVVCHNGEVDVRGTYALLVVATLLDILTPELVKGSYEFLRSCQTYEGGFAASSQPYFSPAPDFKMLPEPRPYLGEAHGGYTSCAVASLVLLRPFVHPSEPSVNAPLLLRWAVTMQGTEISEGGGFRGRTNKLVDGCYSWWVGGLFPLIEELLGEPTGESINNPPKEASSSKGADEDDWSHVDGMDHVLSPLHTHRRSKH
jgi:protein farnesyltransferase subunit beta